jgi:hypothetical protein
MDHKQLATPSGRRKGVFYPNWNSCLLIERPQKAPQKAAASRSGFECRTFPAKLTEITRPRICFRELASCSRRSGQRLSLARFSGWIGLSIYIRRALEIGRL